MLIRWKGVGVVPALHWTQLEKGTVKQCCLATVKTKKKQTKTPDQRGFGLNSGILHSWDPNPLTSHSLNALRPNNPCSSVAWMSSFLLKDKFGEEEKATFPNILPLLLLLNARTQYPSDFSNSVQWRYIYKNLLPSKSSLESSEV